MFQWVKNLFKDKETVFCKDCRWCIPRSDLQSTPHDQNPKWEFAKCESPLNFEEEKKLEDHKLYLVGDGDLDIAEPKRIVKYCEFARSSHACGKKGRWFEPMVAPEIPENKTVS